MAEGTRLLSEYGVTSPIEGSNPSLSVLQMGLYGSTALEPHGRGSGSHETAGVSGAIGVLEQSTTAAERLWRGWPRPGTDQFGVSIMGDKWTSASSRRRRSGT